MTTRPLPPGPPLPALVQTGLMWLAPIRFLHGCHRRYGDRFRVQVPGLGTIVYLTDPEDIRTVLRGDPMIYRAGEAAAPLGEILGTKSLVVLDDEQHARTRGIMLPAFHGDSVRRQVAEMVAITAGEVARWPVGEPFQLAPRMRAITLEVILRTVIGVHEEHRLAALRAALPPLVDIGSPLELLPPPRLLRRVGPWRRRERRRVVAHALLQEEIDRCRRDPELADRSDALAMLVRNVDDSGRSMADDELIDQLVTLLLAGHETTATALSWTFERLTRAPALLERTAQAAADSDDTWLDAVCKESLRARPVVYETGRRVAEPVELAGYHIPVGTLLVPSINLVHRSPQHYPDPEEFRPERFLDQRADTSIWLPFGGGVRRCLGATFAQVEMRTVLREVLRNIELAPTSAPDEGVRVRHVTLAPREGAVVLIRRRITVESGAEQAATA